MADSFLSCYRATGTVADYSRVYDAPPYQGSDNDDNDSTDNLWAVHSELVSKPTVSEHSDPNNEWRMPIDLKRYFSRPTVPLNEDILKFREVNGNMYSHLDCRTLLMPWRQHPFLRRDYCQRQEI